MTQTLFWVCVQTPLALAADFATDNFTVSAPTREIAQQVGTAAEYFRREIAREWLGYELPRWYAKCPIRVKVGQIGAGGQTTFNFHPSKDGPAEVCDWNMQIQGSLERILDSVLPHEVSHTIFACHFRRPLPRWADEGAATLVEHESERRRQVLTVEQVINTKRKIPLRQLLQMKEYPTDMQNVMTLYAEGYSLAYLLVQEGGRSRYLEFLEEAHQHGWDKAIKKHYRYAGVDGLEQRWKEWVLAGSPDVERNPAQLVADNKNRNRKRPAEPGTTLRGQSPDEPDLETPVADRGAPAATGRLVAAGDEPAAEPTLEAPSPRRQRRSAAALREDQEDPQTGLMASAEPPARRPASRESVGREDRPIPADDREDSEPTGRAVVDARKSRELPIVRFDDTVPAEVNLRQKGDDESLDESPRGPRTKNRSDHPEGSATLARGRRPAPVPFGRRSRATWSEFPDDARPQLTAFSPE